MYVRTYAKFDGHNTFYLSIYVYTCTYVRTVLTKNKAAIARTGRVLATPDVAIFFFPSLSLSLDFRSFSVASLCVTCSADSVHPS